MTNEERYWKAEYENLRRKKNKEIEDLKTKMAVMNRKTYELLKGLGLKDADIYVYYRNNG